MSPRPGRIVAQLDVPFARPRARRREIVTSTEFAELRERAMEALGQ
jgi:ABC-type taurine transport system ATPase subunit